MTAKVPIVLVDDHALLRSGLAGIINELNQYWVAGEAGNGVELIHLLEHQLPPEIVLLDINMPKMNGYETCRWLTQNHPGIKVLALTASGDELAIIKMFKAGAKGYILKDCQPSELENALNDLNKKGFYYSELITGKLIQTIHSTAYDGQSNQRIQLSDKEITFLRFSCTELTYKEIASKMNLSPRTIDGYRDELFDKLQVKTRVGLAMYAIRNGIVDFSLTRFNTPGL